MLGLCEDPAEYPNRSDFGPTKNGDRRREVDPAPALVQAPHELGVDLQLIGRQLLQIPQTGESRPEVVQCQPTAEVADPFGEPVAGFGPHAKEILVDIANYTDLSPVMQVSEVVVGQ